MEGLTNDKFFDVPKNFSFSWYMKFKLWTKLVTKLSKAISFCADILPTIARDFVAILGGPHL